jgi:putative glycosyltransferase (TIGR04348 family)
MRIQLVTPAPRYSRKGNRVTAARWGRILRGLGHRAEIHQELARGPCDLLVALHARKSFAAVERYRERYPGRPLIVALTGTDLYDDLPRSDEAQRAVAWADRLIVLQDEALDALDGEARGKARVIYQSAVPTSSAVGKSRRTFDVCVIGHLRPVKDPFLAGAAARRLPESSCLRVQQVGAALTPEMKAEAEREMRENSRYRWLGERPPWQVRRLLKSSHAMVLSSHLEGGANVVSEAVVAGLPVLATRVAGNVGMLGKDYPGYFAVGDAGELAALLDRCEREPSFLADLEARCTALVPRFEPAEEERAWRSLLDELASGAPAATEWR